MNIQTKYQPLIIFILFEYIIFVMCFECYVGENSDYQALRCLSCQVHNFIDLTSKSKFCKGEGISCLCMRATPYMKGDIDIFGSRGGPFVDTHDGLSIHRLPPGSDQLLEAGVLHNTGIRGRDSLNDTDTPQSRSLPEEDRTTVRLFNSGLPDRPRPGVFKKGFAPKGPQSNPDAPILRECWPTLSGGNRETSGCSIQEYRGAWYNICRSVESCVKCVMSLN